MKKNISIFLNFLYFQKYIFLFSNLIIVNSVKEKKNILKILKHKNTLNLKSEKDLENVIVENPPVNFDFDLSSNAAMIIAKLTRENPRNTAEKLKKILLKETKDFSDIDIAGPGFLNFKLLI